MSWEDDRSETRPCPCGSDNFTVTFRSNDWGQHEECWSMHCPKCAETHRVYSYVIMDRKGMAGTRYVWVPRHDIAELHALQESIGKRNDDLTAYLKKYYGRKWVAHFSGVPKKQVWTELTENGRHYPQLSTFYKHVRQSGIAYVLERYFCYDQSETVIRILEIDDANLVSQVIGIADSKRGWETREEQIRVGGHVGTL